VKLFGKRIGAVALALASCGCGSWFQPPPAIHHSKTNVLMLTLCTLRADHLGVYGYERDVSPNIDRLAEEGFRFERVVAQAPWTKSSIAAMITGMYPRSMNIEDPGSEENYRRLHDGFTTLAEVMQAHDYYTLGVTANPNTAAVFNMDQGYDFYRDPGVLWQDDYRKSGVWNSEEVSRLFLEGLRDRPAGEKFFAHLVFIDVHSPRYHKVKLDAEDNFEVPPPQRRTPIDMYDLQVSFLDRNIGLLLRDLRELGYGDDLLVVINSDHGEGLGDHGSLDRGHSRLVYNSTIWVPWIIHHPQLEPAVPTRSSMVRQIDMMPTMLQMLGIEASHANRGLSSPAGTSRWGDIRKGTPSAGVERAFVRTQFMGADKAAVLTAEHKLILNFDHRKKMKSRLIDSRRETYFFPPEFELYRYRADPLEAEDIYPTEPELALGLEADYRGWEAAFPPLVSEDELQVSPSEVTEQLEALKALGYVGDD
jgi:arylsulfatase A-like enzyme